MSKDKDDSISFGIGLLAGVVGGIIAGIIYAPKPGAETRADLVDKAIKIKNNLPRKVECAKKKSLDSIDHTKASIENIIEGIQDSLRAQKMANAKLLEAKVLKEQK